MEDVGPGEMGPVTIAFGWILDYPPNVGICTPQKQHRLKEKLIQLICNREYCLIRWKTTRFYN